MTIELEKRVSKLEVDMQEVKETLQLVAQLQMQNQQQLNQLGQRVDAFVVESQRVFANLGAG